MIRKTGIISVLLIANQAAFATDCVVPAKFNAKNRDALIVCEQTEIDELKGIPAASELTQTIGDFMVATVRQATQGKMTSNNYLATTAVFTLKNISTEPLYIGAVSYSFNISDDQGGSQSNMIPAGWPNLYHGPSDLSIPGNQTIIPPKASVTITLSSSLNHSAYTQPQTMSFGGNFYKLNADGTVETFGVEFNGVKIKHP